MNLLNEHKLSTQYPLMENIIDMSYPTKYQYQLINRMNDTPPRAIAWDEDHLQKLLKYTAITISFLDEGKLKYHSKGWVILEDVPTKRGNIINYT